MVLAHRLEQAKLKLSGGSKNRGFEKWGFHCKLLFIPSKPEARFLVNVMFKSGEITTNELGLRLLCRWNN